jgi:hypothetical protein
MRTYLAMLLESHPDPYVASALDVPDTQKIAYQNKVMAYDGHNINGNSIKRTTF